MKQQQFEAQYRALWVRFAELLADSTKKKSKKEAATKDSEVSADLTSEQSRKTTTEMTNEPKGYEFVRLYRLICQHYALAQ